MKNDRKAMSLIVQCVKDNQLESLREKKTAYSMWTTLEQKHEKKGLPGQLYLKKRMMLMNLNEGEELAGFLNRFDKIVRQLKATGVGVDEKDIICNLLLTLPKSFETVVTIIENLPPDKLEYEDVKKKLLADEEKRCLGKKKTTIAIDQTAFNTEIVCFRCGRSGHIKRNCRANNENNGATSYKDTGDSRQFRNHRIFQHHASRDFNGTSGFRGGSNRGFPRGYRGNHFRGTSQRQQYTGRSNLVEQEESSNQVSDSEVNQSMFY